MPSRDFARPASAHRPAARGAIGTLVAAFALMAPAQALAQAPDVVQPLLSKSLQWILPLPAVPAPLLPISSAREPGNSFLKGRFLVGMNLTHSLTPDEDLGSHWSYAPLIRNTPRRLGWGPSFSLSGYRGDIVVPVNGQRTTIGELKIRPLMGGVSYSIGPGRARTSFSLVGGYAFTSAKVTAALPSGTTASIDIGDAWVVRPNVGLTYAVTRRLAIIGSAGYVYTRPTIRVTVNQPVKGPPTDVTTSFRSDFVSLTVGIAYSIF